MAGAAQPLSPVKLIATLVIICSAAAAMLAGVKDLTDEPIAAALREERLKAIRAVLPAYVNEPDTDTVELQTPKGLVTGYVGRDAAGNAVGIAAPGTSGKAYGGELTVLVGVTPDGKVNGIEVMVMKETPGLGDTVAKPSFLKQFLGQALGGSYKFEVEKDGGDVDAITAATITSRAAAEAIQQALERAREMKDKAQ